jgi:hypothetical protein
MGNPLMTEIAKAKPFSCGHLVLFTSAVKDGPPKIPYFDIPSEKVAAILKQIVEHNDESHLKTEKESVNAILKEVANERKKGRIELAFEKGL